MQFWTAILQTGPQRAKETRPDMGGNDQWGGGLLTDQNFLRRVASSECEKSFDKVEGHPAVEGPQRNESVKGNTAARSFQED